jgi:PAS domain S-box-containing protein
VKARFHLAPLVASALVLVTTTLLVAVGSFTYASRQEQEMKRLRQSVVVKADELAVGLALPIWNIDRDQIDKILEGLEATPAIYAVQVEAAGKRHLRVRDQHWHLAPANRISPREMTFAEERPILFSRQQVGTVRLVATEEFVAAEARRTLLSVIASILLVDLLLLAAVYLIFWRVILRPLTEIERYAVAVSESGQAESIERNRVPTIEIENVRVSIESMVRLLAQRYADLQNEMFGRQESEERFRTIFESVNDAIFIYDSASGEIVNANHCFDDMYGVPPDSGGSAMERVSSGVEPYTPEQFSQRIRASAEGRAQLFEWQSKRADGTLFWTEMSAHKAVIAGLPRIVVVVRDVSERKAMEEALRRSETMSAMGVLVAGVAHEVRNPLFGISSLLDAYAPELSEGELAEFSSRLRREVTRLTQLMTELLEFGRPATLTLVPAPLHELLTEVVASRASAAQKANVALHCNVDASLSLVSMDGRRLRQVFENLVDNALQHAPAVQNVTIAAEQVVDTGREWVECRVFDDGPGFQNGDLTRVFEPFFTRRDRGVGLGLSIVQRIVEEHSGRVSASNHSPHGAMVTVRLPVQAELRDSRLVTRY